MNNIGFVSNSKDPLAVLLSFIESSKVNDSTDASHPFKLLTNQHSEVVLHKSNVYVPCIQKTNIFLQSSGVKKNLQLLGPVESYINIPPANTIIASEKNVCDDAAYYYKNFRLLETDLLRYTNSQYRRKYFLEFFSNSFYIKNDIVHESGSLNRCTTAIFTNCGSTVAFENTIRTNSKVCNVMSLESDSHKTVQRHFIDLNSIQAVNISSRKVNLFAYNLTTFTTRVPYHEINAKGQKFAFKDATLETSCFFSKGSMQLANYPRVVDAGYKHFFVHANGDVCYNGDQRFADIGLRKGKWYSLEDKTLGYKLARVLEQGLLNLTRGYTETCNPVNRPEGLLELAV